MQGTWVLRGTKGDEGDERIGGAMRAHHREDPALVDGVGCDFVQLHSKPRGPDSPLVSRCLSARPAQSVSQCLNDRTQCNGNASQPTGGCALLRTRGCAAAVAPQ